MEAQVAQKNSEAKLSTFFQEYQQSLHGANSQVMELRSKFMAAQETHQTELATLYRQQQDQTDELTVHTRDMKTEIYANEKVAFEKGEQWLFDKYLHELSVKDQQLEQHAHNQRLEQIRT